MRNVAIIGATGVVGQQFVIALQNHKWFNITKLAASKRSAGKNYEDALRNSDGALNWFCEEKPSSETLKIKVEDASKIKVESCDIVFTALESEQAKVFETKYAKIKPVISTAATFRYDVDVPTIIPGINNEHIKLLDIQKKRRGWKGFVIPIPNCTTTGLAVTLKPILDKFGLEQVLMTSMQALSGAGRSPGVSALDILDNVIPYIPKEEEKVQTETLKILGKLNNKKIKPAQFKVSCTCTRVHVRDGHTESVFVSTKTPNTIEDVKKAMNKFGKDLIKMKLPSAPKQMIEVTDDPFRPQPRIDRYASDGMVTTVGRIRRDTALKNGMKYVLVSHNTKMGAAKGAVLVAELLDKEGYLD